MLVLRSDQPRRLRWLRLDFLTLHWAYFIALPLLLSIIFWAPSLNTRQVSFVDSLFLTFSAITEAGLNTVALSELTLFQQILLLILIGVGSVPPVSWVLVCARKRAFDQHYGKAIAEVLTDVDEFWNTRPSSLSGFAPYDRLRRLSNASFATSSHLIQEYEALKLLRCLIPAYFLTFQVLGCIGLGAWISVQLSDVARTNGLSPFWDGIFFGVSAFNNSGMSIQDNNLTAFKNDAYLLLTIGILILAGNTCYPVCLRAIVWILWKILPRKRFARTRHTLRFLLDHPRDVYTHIFPSQTTWFLLATVIMLNCVDWAAFEILNINNRTVNTLPLVARILDGLIQAFAVRFGGFYVAPIADLNIALLVLYVLMMYIGAFPVIMSMRTTNVYDQSEVSSQMQTQTQMQPQPSSAMLKFWRSRILHSVSSRVSDQLSHDLWYLCLSIFFIMIIESSSFASDPVNFSVFNVIFEVVSAYGTVGISVGVPYATYSFCGAWHSLSKLILITVMLRGRHRGLPDVIDRAVLMPGVKVVDLSQGVSNSTDKLAEGIEITEVHIASQQNMIGNGLRSEAENSLTCRKRTADEMA